MADIIGVAASAAGGGLFGLAGTAIGRVAGYFERRQQHDQERALWAHQVELQDAELLARREDAAAKLEAANADGRWKGLAASLQAEAAIGASYAWVNAVRGLTRPGLTLLLWAITAGIYASAGAAERGQIVETATFAATAATLWWFGDRGPQQKPNG